jgi:two-component system, response regulator PdtaR
MISIDPGPFTVLVVEDQALLRMSAALCVEDAGYLALSASDADEAMQTMHDNDTIDAVFTDIHMPGSMDGLAFAHKVRRLWPAMPILIVSGKEAPSEEAMPEHAQFLPKPYSAKLRAPSMDF